MNSVLPSNSGLYERAFEETWSVRWPTLEAAADAIKGAKFNPPPSFLPFLVYEYGLGELTPYVPNLYTLVVEREGVDWQRIRGTPAAVYKGLGWLGYGAALEDAWHGRNYWNSTQLRFSALPTVDFPDLERIEGITRLSLPKRSQLRRGVYQYDVQPAEGDMSFLDGCMLDVESGVSVTPAGTVWSFGRVTEVEHVLTEDEGLAIGNWIAPPEDGGIQWTSMQYPWVTATFRWADTPANQRRSLMASWFEARTLFVTFRDADGLVIGHRRCRAVHAVNQAVGGAYRFGSVQYARASDGRRVYVEALTDFDDAWDEAAKSIELRVGAVVDPSAKAGQLWLHPDELIGGQAVAVSPVTIPLRKTVREQIKFIVRF